MTIKMKSLVGALALTLAAIGQAQAQQTPSAATQAVPVTVENFARAESDMYFADHVRQGMFGKIVHIREVAPVDNKGVVRPNRDTLYSLGVFDLDAAPLTITLPDAKRYMALQVISEDHYVPEVAYAPGKVTITRKMVGTRYAMIAIRTLVNPADPKDVEKVHQLQDAIKVSQATAGKFEEPDWDQVSQKKVREALLVLASTLPDFRHAFGTRTEVDPVRHLLGTAAAWGGNPDKDAIYLNVTPPKNNGSTQYRLKVKDVPVDGFWSVTVYNSQGRFEPNPYNAYSLNNITATKGDDGAITVQFGGCDGKVPNCLPIMPGWNYTVRLYRPHEAVLKGTWTFPQPQAMQ
ncbi:DUF1254 domain-containing protein [Paraburkholderia sacchari]|uniref:DUF1254 domain-containing protein n=1 Tax=Paraburkholderia sacchari TaxID=159450 RepID=UPI001FD4C18D|nr:DUF1254 domain-containing protein [Paraburkholderia sacchari]